MADRVLSQKSQIGQTFINAMWIAGFLALVQVSAVGYAIYKRSGEPMPAAVGSASAETDEPDFQPTDVVETTAPVTFGVSGDSQDLTAAAAPSFPRDIDQIPKEESIDELSTGPDPRLIRLGRKAPDLSNIRDEVGVIDNYLFRGMVENGRFYRAKGNYTTALNDLKDVEANLPEHPLVLSELAGTYGEMGQLEKASEYWTKVTALGPILGGAYYKIAAKVLNGQNPMVPDFAPGQVLKLGKIEEQHLGVNAEGEQVVITIPVFGDRRSGAIDIKKMNWNAQFYDLINNRTVGRTIAKVIDQYPTGPYDWNDDSIEKLEVIYHMPQLSVEDQQIQGKREYSGYAIKLFYEGILQDSVVSSDEIKKLMFSTQKPSPQRQSAPLTAPGPDSSLFPRGR